METKYVFLKLNLLYFIFLSNFQIFYVVIYQAIKLTIITVPSGAICDIGPGAPGGPGVPVSPFGPGNPGMPSSPGSPFSP